LHATRNRCAYKSTHRGIDDIRRQYVLEFTGLGNVDTILMGDRVLGTVKSDFRFPIFNHAGVNTIVVVHGNNQITVKLILYDILGITASIS
jgi:hypothetical protein